MTFDMLRTIRNANPFRPFEIHTASGESYMVLHPEEIALSADDATAVVLPGGGRIGIIDIQNITDVVTFPTSSKSGPDEASAAFA